MKLPFFGKKSAAGGDDLESYMRSIVQSAVELRREETDAEPPLGTSKIGGKPHLPADFVWPRFAGESYEDGWAERPLSFIAQLDLAAVAAYDTEHRLPTSGYLYFFYDIVTQCWGLDPEDEGCARVYHLNVPAEALVETDLPAELAEEARVPLQLLSLATVKELPGYEEFIVLTDKTRFGETFSWDLYDETAERILAPRDCAPEEVCKLLGYADLIQGPILYECAMTEWERTTGQRKKRSEMTPAEKAAFTQSEREWVLLAQFGTLSEEILFGDCGCIYFYIRRDDLAEGRFDRIHLSLQCG